MYMYVVPVSIFFSERDCTNLGIKVINKNDSRPTNPIFSQPENWNHLIFLLKFISTAFHTRVPLMMAKSV